MYERTMIQ